MHAVELSRTVAPVPREQRIGDGGVGNVTDLTVLPDRAYTGFDGTHAYQLPVSVAGSASDLTLTASDPSAVDIKPAVNTNPEADPSEKWFLVTTKKAGSVTLTARSGGKSAESKLTITAYSTARWDTGNQRYHNGEGGDPPCAQCHEKAGGPDHSPLTLSPVDDESAKTVITAGIVNNIPIKGVNHKWQARACRPSRSMIGPGHPKTERQHVSHSDASPGAMGERWRLPPAPARMQPLRSAAPGDGSLMSFQCQQLPWPWVIRRMNATPPRACPDVDRKMIQLGHIAVGGPYLEFASSWVGSDRPRR